MIRLWAGVMLAAGLLTTWPAASEPVVHARIDRDLAVFVVNHDLTYTRTETYDATLYTDRALRRLDRLAATFYPDQQALDVIEAWVDQPDGTRIEVANSSIFTRPSEASESAPGFVNSMTTTVLFPQLRHGSRTHVVWRLTQKVPALLGFNAYNLNIFGWDTGRDETRIEIPADVPLHWRARGGFAVEDTVTDGIRHISAHVDGTHGRVEEAAMVDPFDFMPLFIATTLPNIEEIGSILWRESKGRADVTPEIAALAARIAGDRTGLDAARAIHAWVTQNIRYVAVYLNPDDGFIPHAAAAVLKAGYGDCKDYVVLMRALLAARGIEGQMAVIDWGSRYAEPLLWSPTLFNHAILYLPSYDHFVNPTDRDAGFDALDRRLSGKPVLIVSKEGRLARTPDATADANRYRYEAHLTLGADGALDGTAHFTMAPNVEIPVRHSLASASSMSDMAQRMLVYTPEGGFGGFEASDPRDLSQPLVLTATWHSPMAVNVQERNIFLRVPIGLDMYPLSRERSKLSPDGKRQTPVIADVTDAGWETTIALPPGMTVVRLPSDADLVTPAGRYTARYTMEDGAIHVWRNLVIGQQVVQPDAYPDLERLIYAPMMDSRAIIELAPEVWSKHAEGALLAH
jgi:transglutaminase-like putative cysteine protease